MYRIYLLPFGVINDDDNCNDNNADNFRRFLVCNRGA